jgi:hypothetical protein
LSVGDRFAIALRLVPTEERPRVLRKSAAHARRYEQGTDIPLSVVSALSKETEIPMEWISTGRAMPRAGAATARDETAAYLAQSDFDVSAEHIRLPKMILQSSGIAPQNARLMERPAKACGPPSTTAT